MDLCLISVSKESPQARKPTKHQTLQGNRQRVPHRKETVMIKHLYTKKVQPEADVRGRPIKSDHGLDILLPFWPLI